MSSTAIGLGVLAERNLMATTSGESVLSVALLQDIAAIPILALLPFLAVAAGHDAGGGWLGAAKAAARSPRSSSAAGLLLRPTLRWIAKSDTPESSPPRRCCSSVATAALMSAVGLSMALGAFLAGVLLAESEYRRELETDIEPFKGLLLGLFFIAVGMNIDFQVVLDRPLLIGGRRRRLPGGQGRRALGDGPRRCRSRSSSGPVFIILLAQGGEFGFVVFQTATPGGRDPAPAVVVPDRRGDDLDAADAAAARRRRPLVDPDPRRAGARERRRGAVGAAERPGDHRRLRPLRPDRRPACCSPTASRRPCSITTPRRSRRCASSAGACTTATRPGST
jgi:Kef-type K+ transport system membrane component KefB